MDDVVWLPRACCGVAFVALLLNLLEPLLSIRLALWHTATAMRGRALLIVCWFHWDIEWLGETHGGCNLSVHFHGIGVVLEVGDFLVISKVVSRNGFHPFRDVVESSCLCGVVCRPPFLIIRRLCGRGWVHQRVVGDFVFRWWLCLYLA